MPGYTYRGGTEKYPYCQKVKETTMLSAIVLKPKKLDQESRKCSWPKIQGIKLTSKRPPEVNPDPSEIKPQSRT